MLNSEVLPEYSDFSPRYNPGDQPVVMPELTNNKPSSDKISKYPILFPILHNSELSQLPPCLMEALTKLFKEHHSDLTSQDKLVLKNWVVQLHHVFIHQLASSSHYPKDAFLQGLVDFILHPDHGIYHSLLVYRGMQHLQKLQGSGYKQLPDVTMQMVSLLHDITQGFQQIDVLTGKEMKVNARAKHGQAIALVFKLFGKQLGFSPQEVREMYWALRDHDNGYNRRDMADGRYGLMAALLHDADKLFGASRNHESIELLVEQIIRRNYLGNQSIMGSYLFRHDLSWEYRLRFTYGDRWFNDCLTVVLFELFGMPHFSRGGRAIAEQMRPVVFKVLLKTYLEVFDEHQQLYQRWRETGTRLSIVGWSHENDEPKKVSSTFQKEEVIGPAKQLPLEGVIQILTETPIILAKRYKRSAYNFTQDARGWKIRLFFSDQSSVLVDPSVLFFVLAPQGREQFTQALIKSTQQAENRYHALREKYEHSSQY